jgi:hypothetical protein
VKIACSELSELDFLNKEKMNKDKSFIKEEKNKLETSSVCQYKNSILGLYIYIFKSKYNNKNKDKTV